MYRLLLTLFISLLFEAGFSQVNISQSVVGWKGADFNLDTVHDETNRYYATILSSKDSFRIFLLNGGDSIIRVFSLAREPDELVRGGFVNDENIFIFCGSRFPAGLHNYRIHINDGAISQNHVPATGANGEYLARLSSGSSYLFFSANKKTSEIIISDWKSNDNVSFSRYPFPYHKLWHDLTADASTQTTNVAKIDVSGLLDLADLQNQRKLYLVHDSLLLLMNQDSGFKPVCLVLIPAQKQCPTV